MHFQAIYKPQTSLSTFTSTSTGLGFLAHQGSCSPADGRREPSSERQAEICSSLQSFRSFTASSAAKEQNQIRNKNMDYAFEQTLSLYTDRHSPQKSSAVKRGR